MIRDSLPSPPLHTHTLPKSPARSTSCWTMTACRELGRTRSDRLLEERRTLLQIVDSSLVVPSLDVPVPQLENQLVEASRLLDLHIPEQVIEVPKISSSSRRSRRRRVPTVTAEQLVEVPTIVSFSSLHGVVERNVEIPVPRGRGGRGGGRRSSRFTPWTEFTSV